jgi:DNA-binding HxlR family transcriptional regulator
MKFSFERVHLLRRQSACESNGLGGESTWTRVPMNGIDCEVGTLWVYRYLMDTDLEIVYAKDCPSRTVLGVLANKWSLYVLGLLRQKERPLRFTELRRHIEGVTQKSLTQALRNLERDGLISRTVYPTVPPRVEYRLTDLGLEAGALTTAIADWSKANAYRVQAARSAYDNRATQQREEEGV